MTICKQCGTEFPDLTDDVKEKYRKNNWKVPDMCPECRAKYKAHKISTPSAPVAKDVPAPVNYYIKCEDTAMKIKEAYNALVEVFGSEERLSEIRKVVGDISGWATTIFLSDNKRGK